MLLLEIIQCCKMQIACLIILFYIGIQFIRDGNYLNQKSGKALCNHYFDNLFIIGEICIVFDGATAYTVNHLELIPDWANGLLHMIYLLLFELFICVHYLYWKDVTGSMPKKKSKGLLWTIPMIVCGLATIITMPTIYYVEGTYTNFSSGLPVYSCYVCVGIYTLLTILLFARKNMYIEKQKKISAASALAAVFAIMALLLTWGESLFAALAVDLIIVSIYLIMENPTVKEVKVYHENMIMGFATLIENKDDSTGGHIIRTSKYAEIIAKELRKDEKYHNIITKDFMENLKLAAPMHDVGKIGIPDVILQKPGKLEPEEYETMKKHPVIGGKIIRDTFGHLMDENYEEMAFQVAYYHHEKWNGKGYPEGIKETEIPLCARIMAVADVFDAVSAKRCYRDALPLETCFKIIREGKGTDFDPEIVDAFFRCEDMIREIAGSGR